MSNEEFIVLAAKVADGEASLTELALYNAAYNSFETANRAPLPANIDALEQQSITELREQFGVQRPKIKLWPRIAGIAAAIICISVCLWLFRSAIILNLFQDPDALAMKNDIAPGGNGATLTFANGEVIDLSSQKNGVIIGDDLTYDDNTLVVQSNPLSSRANAKDLDPSKVGMTRKQWDDKAVEMTASTAKGQTYTFTLPDGTKVWLNADSKLEFFSNYRKKAQRIVKLITGEAYFEVAKDKAHPFIVESNGQSTEVLGTHFNISAYSDDVGIRTTLLEGSVRVSSSRREERSLKHATSRDSSVPRNDVVLKPNQQSLVTANNKITIKQVDASEAIAWKNGDFMFESESIPQIMKIIARWYDVEVMYQGAVPDYKFNGSISKFSNVSKVLQVLESSKKVHFKIEGRKIIVTK